METCRIQCVFSVLEPKIVLGSIEKTNVYNICIWLYVWICLLTKITGRFLGRFFKSLPPKHVTNQHRKSVEKKTSSQSHVKKNWWKEHVWLQVPAHTVDGWNPVNSPVEGTVVFPTIYKVSAPSQVVQDCSHQQYFFGLYRSSVLRPHEVDDTNRDRNRTQAICTP